ncbi:hypothetical protein [Edaphobacillus lindanitolerans]|uniref:Uncharacterized protein n=1 Tax=Edaphobacillus lindanitolerans TaxID=550447 RepID=A0A1U7PJ98_9BACI|nr:hypothetical protein [Edaphobacillus lindanitolerans]SIT80866.1 hypothetical protein SAMN05428946_1355 [Edaphobacillus lindanitolerans]
MKLMQWAYTRKYQVKAVFDDFPETVFLFRRIGEYYFLFSSRGGEYGRLPERHDYAVMEELVNGELGTLHQYRNRRSARSLGVS